MATSIGVGGALKSKDSTGSGLSTRWGRGSLSRHPALRPTRDDRYMITKNWRVFAALSLQGTLGISLFSGSSVVSNFEVKFHC